MRKTALALLLLTCLAPAAPAADGPVTLEGPVVQGGIVFGRAPAGSSVTVDGHDIMISDAGRFVLGFSRDDTDAHELAVSLPSGEIWARTLKPADREFDIQRIDGLPQDKVTPSEDVLERIHAEAARVARARKRRDDRTDWSDGFIRPVEGPVTGVYGSQRILNGEPRNPHWGIDYAAPTGTPVQAPAAGVITLTHADMYFSGGTVLLDHGQGLVSAFLHLSAIDVESGQRVEQGDIIGKVGASGRATGPHLDWRVNWGDVRVDAGVLVDETP